MRFLGRVLCVMCGFCEAGVDLTRVCSPKTNVPVRWCASFATVQVSNTVDDVCLDGVCLGIDTCAGVACSLAPPPDLQCRLSDGTCILGNCSWSLALPGTACDDGDNETTFDVCDASGECAGTNMCTTNAVVCPDRQCHVTPPCFQGLCPALSEYSPVADGSPCSFDPEIIAELL